MPTSHELSALRSAIEREFLVFDAAMEAIEDRALKLAVKQFGQGPVRALQDDVVFARKRGETIGTLFDQLVAAAGRPA